MHREDYAVAAGISLSDGAAPAASAVSAASAASAAFVFWLTLGPFGLS